MRNDSDKIYRENQNTFYVQYIFFFENPVLYVLFIFLMAGTLIVHH